MLKKLTVIEEAKRMSFSLVAESHGLTRNQVAGIVWRHRNPYSTRVLGPSGKRNKCGRGHHGGGVWPRMTLRNSR